jgi:hypothetical protein
MRLINPTDRELNLAFAREICEFTDETMAILDSPQMMSGRSTDLDFTTSADGVLPYLDKCDEVEIKTMPHGLWSVIVRKQPGGMGYQNFGDSVPRVAVLALLRAHGVEIEFSP